MGEAELISAVTPLVYITVVSVGQSTLKVIRTCYGKAWIVPVTTYFFGKSPKVSQSIRDGLCGAVANVVIYFSILILKALWSL